MLIVLDNVDCGGVSVPSELLTIVSTIIKFIYIGIPILLIIWGMLDLGKAVISQKEDEIKKGQSTFVKRLIAALIVFFVVVLVKAIIGVLPINNSEGIVSCIDKMVNGG